MKCETTCSNNWESGLNMQAVPLAGSIFLCLLGSYRLEEQDNRSFIMEIFLTGSTMTKAL